ncbi:MAG: hypothetical protein AB7G25_01225 [Sphingomonadaceae bacterium]
MNALHGVNGGRSAEKRGNVMRMHRQKFMLAGHLALLMAVSGCSQESATKDEPAVPATQADNSEMISKNVAAGMNWFGGPVYSGEPALGVTAALVKAGGGADGFSFEKALVSMLGEDTTKAEVVALTRKYGAKDVSSFIQGMDLAVASALKHATEAGIKLPEPAPLEGAGLAKALIQAGTVPDGTFWSGYLFDKALSHDIHNQVMADIEAQRGPNSDLNVHKILNQAMYDVAQALDMKKVKLAALN